MLDDPNPPQWGREEIAAGGREGAGCGGGGQAVGGDGAGGGARLVLELCGDRLQVGAWVGVTRLMGVVETAGRSCAHMLPGILHFKAQPKILSNSLLEHNRPTFPNYPSLLLY